MKANVERFMGFADVYDAARPQPPEAVCGMLANLLGRRRPRVVVDVGCGTGLSTRIWAGRAGKVIGVDPSADMLAEARRKTPQRNVEYRQGLSFQTGLADACADIVTCVQCLHWMPPRPTFAEIARIVRPGGVFAAIDADWPPVLPNTEAQRAYQAVMDKARQIAAKLDAERGVKRWNKDHHLRRIRQSGHFDYACEIVAHQVEPGNARRLVLLTESFGHVATLLKLGVRREELGLNELAAVARRTLGSRMQPWYFGYRVRIGITPGPARKERSI